MRPLLASAALALLAAATAATAAAPAHAAEATFPFAQGLPGAIDAARAAGPSPAEIRRLKSAVRGTSLAPSETEPHWACPESICDELIDPAPHAVGVGARRRYLSAARRLYEGSGEKGGLDPQDLQSAYRIPSSSGQGQTVGIVDAYGYPDAEEALATYRKKYDLSPCTKANGCLEVINQHGEEANLPPEERGWDGEQALDIEMVSAACPACKIVLAQADTPSYVNLGEAEEAAARAGAQEISNSYGSPEEGCQGGCAGETSPFDIPGVMVFVAAGDWGYDDQELGYASANFPATLPFVTAVGGTNLRKASGVRGWEDTVWAKGGSGCSRYEPKPAWQHDPSCTHRMVADVAAEASCETPVSVYDVEGWNLVCGTSASSPLVAGIEAHASAATRSLPGADAFYNDPRALFDVTSGSNGSCTPPAQDAYFCQAQAGYDGPTGNGVPDGSLGVESSSPDVDTLAPESVSSTSAELVGLLEPQGQQARYRFEYGTSTAYGSNAPEAEGTVAAGYSGETVRATVTGLEAGRTYHFRLVATNPTGTSQGSDMSFDTYAPSVTSVSPGSGPPDGGTTVTIEGGGFDGASAVRFGRQEAPYFELLSAHEIRAQAPYGSGTVAVTVSAPGGQSEPEAAASFTYGKPGSILGWGSDSDGALGTGVSGGSADVPLEVMNLREAVQLAPGGFQSFALTGSGTIMSWGTGAFGGLGDYSEGEAAPAEVCAVAATQEECDGGSDLREVTAVASGEFFGLALLRDGRVVSWGSDEVGSLGRPQPGRFPELEDDRTPGYVCTTDKGTPGECAKGKYLEGVTAIAAGEDFALALLRNGTVMGWGSDFSGQLGAVKQKKLSSCRFGFVEHEPTGPCSYIPVKVEGVSEVSAIAAGDAHALALLENATVMAWGNNESGQLGTGASVAHSPPAAVCEGGQTAPCAHALSGVKAIAAGDAYSAALLADGHVLTWGDNYRGRLGDGSLEGPESCSGEPCSRTPVAVQGLEDVTTIAAGEQNSNVLAITGSGQIFTWGGDLFGQLGDGLEEAEPSPVRVCAPFAYGPCPQGPYLEGQVTSLGVGGYHDLISMTIAPAIVSEVSPKAGPGAGGTSVTITGSGFSDAQAVRFGSVPAASFEVRSDEEIVAVAPRGSGSVEVSVSTPEGSSEPRIGDKYTYEEPVIASLSPDFGPAGGDTRVTISGSDLAGVSAVDFGQTPAAEFEVRSAQEVVAVSAPGEGGVHVAVTTPNGTSAATEADWFTYQSAPTVAAEPAEFVHARSAWVRASIDPNLEKVTDCVVEYGTSAEYGRSRYCGKELGDGSHPESVSLELTGLTPGTTYHYRFKAENALGVTRGEGGEFTTLSTALPELGRCVALPLRDGGFENEGCTAPSAARDGAFEWEPGPGAHAGFEAAARGVTLATRKGGVIRCSALELEGSYTGAWNAELSRGELTRCKVSKSGEGLLAKGASGSCQSPGASPGEIRLEALQAMLGAAYERHLMPAWALQAAGPEWASFDCGSEELLLAGGTVGVLEPGDGATARFAVKFDGKKAPRDLAGETESTYTLWFPTVIGKFWLDEELVWLSASPTLQGEEALEINTTE